MSQASRFQASHAGSHPAQQSFHKPHTSLGVAGHWLRTGGILAPLAIGEFVPDPEQKMRYIRFAAIATAVLSEALWTNKIRKERDEAREHCAAGSGRER